MSDLTAVLTDARELGLLGPGPVTDHVAHAEGFARGWTQAPATVVDLGSGAGVPGLVLAVAHPALAVVLVDGRRRSTSWLREAVRRLDLESRVTVIEERAEVFGHDPAWRDSAPMVVARGFGPPAVLAECAAPLLAADASLVVSEPPTADASRWPAEPLATLGLRATDRWETAAGHYQRLVRVGPCPDRYPRRVGVPAKRPLWS